MIDEGQLFNKRLWELSILRLNQLDYFDRIEADKAAEIKRNTKEGTVDINLKLKEKGKQSIGLPAKPLTPPCRPIDCLPFSLSLRLMSTVPSFVLRLISGASPIRPTISWVLAKL